MDAILKLVQKRATTEADNSFAIHPPKKLVDCPELAESENVIDELKDSVFSVVFQDGTAKMLSLVELMVLTYLLLRFLSDQEAVNKVADALQPTQATKIDPTSQFAVGDIMRPEMVKALLDKIEFSDSPSDD